MRHEWRPTGEWPRFAVRISVHDNELGSEAVDIAVNVDSHASVESVLRSAIDRLNPPTHEKSSDEDWPPARA